MANHYVDSESEDEEVSLEFEPEELKQFKYEMFTIKESNEDLCSTYKPTTRR